MYSWLIPWHYSGGTTLTFWFPIIFATSHTSQYEFLLNFITTDQCCVVTEIMDILYFYIGIIQIQRHVQSKQTVEWQLTFKKRPRICLQRQWRTALCYNLRYMFWRPRIHYTVLHFSLPCELMLNLLKSLVGPSLIWWSRM